VHYLSYRHSHQYHKIDKSHRPREDLVRCLVLRLALFMYLVCQQQGFVGASCAGSVRSLCFSGQIVVLSVGQQVFAFNQVGSSLTTLLSVLFGRCGKITRVQIKQLDNSPVDNICGVALYQHICGVFKSVHNNVVWPRYYLNSCTSSGIKSYTKYYPTLPILLAEKHFKQLWVLSPQLPSLYLLSQWSPNQILNGDDLGSCRSVDHTTVNKCYYVYNPPRYIVKQLSVSL